MSTLSDFLHMGGYAFYVWTAYGVVAVVLAGNVASALARRRHVLHELTRRERLARRRAREAA